MPLLFNVVIVPRLLILMPKAPEIVPLLVSVVTVLKLSMPKPSVVIMAPLLTVKLQSVDRID